MSTKNVTLKEKVNGVLGDTIFPATITPNVYDPAKSQALSQTLVNTPDYEALGFAKFSTATAYNAGDKVYKDNELYRFIADKTAGEWNVAKVEPWSIEQEIEEVDNAKYEKPAGGIPKTDLAGGVQTSLDKADTAMQRVLFMETSFGKYNSIRDITLSQGKSGKYVNVDGTETSAAGYGISNAVELNFGDILLVPSAEAVPASVSVVARVGTRAYAKIITYTYTYQQEDPTLYDTATADYDPTLVYTAVYDTSGETPVLTGWTIGGETIETLPATHEVTESYYEPLVKQAVSAMPSTGYYVYLCPSAMTVVISGYTATVDGGVCKVVGWGIFKNIVSNFIGAPGQSVLAQLLCDLDARVKGIMARLENLGEVKAITIDSENLPKVCGQPLVVEGAGAPSVVPQFVGQRYHDITNNKCYEAFAVTGATSNWKLLN